MNQSLLLFFENLVHMLRGAMLMMFVVMCMGLYAQRRKNPVQNYLFWLMVIMSGFLLVSVGYMFEELRNGEVFKNFKTLLDFCLVPMIASFFLKIVIPNRFNGRKALLMLLPAIVFMAVHTLTHDKLLLTLTFVYSIVVVVVVFSFVVYTSIRYDRILKDNFSDIDNKSIAWVRTTIYIFAAWYVAWIVVATCGSNNWLNAGYYIFLISIWTFIYRHSVRHVAAVKEHELFEQQNIAGATETNEANKIEDTTSKLGAELELYMAQAQPWMNPSLTLQELAVLLNTNRTYLSEYFNKTLETNFYDYVNSFRIHQACEILLSQPELSLSAVGEMSGFNSLSTFRRAFEKSLGCSPAAYRKNEENTNL